MTEEARSKRPRVDYAGFASEERRYHMLLDKLVGDRSGSLPCILHPGADVVALKEAVSRRFREIYGINDDSEEGSVYNPGARHTGRSGSSLEVPRRDSRASESRMEKETPTLDETSSNSSSLDSDDTSSGDEESEEDTSKSSDSEGSHQKNGSRDTYKDCMDLTVDGSDSTSSDGDYDSDDEAEAPPVLPPTSRNKRKSPPFEAGSDEEDDRITDSGAGQDAGMDDHSLPHAASSQSDNEQGENMDVVAALGASPASSEVESQRTGNDEFWSDEDNEDGSDLDDHEEEMLVRQICRPRAKSHAKDSEDNDDDHDISEENLDAEPVEPDEEITILRCNGRTYEAGKTYFRGTTYMYGILKLCRRPDGKEYAECAQVLKLSDTFLSSVESQRHEYVRLAGVEKMGLDSWFGEEVDKVEGIPELVYEVNRGKRLHFAFYPLTKTNGERKRLSSEATVLDLFSGAGGMNLGFHAAGFETAMAVEKNPFAVQTLSAHVNRIFPGDIGSFLSASHNKSYRSQIGPVHHVHGSPPCQGFSAANRTGGRNDIANNDLSLQFLEVVKVYKPETATYEMVTGILQEKHRIYLKTIILGLIEAGYKVRCSILNASDYGDPQNRKRLVLFAARTGIELPRVPRPTHGESRHLLPRQTVRDAIGDLPLPHTSSTSEMEYAGSPLFNTWYPQTVASPGDPDVVVLNPEEPSSTIRGGSRPPFHYKPRRTPNGEPKYRCISLREMATLQSFPKDFKFWGNHTEQRKQVGNAVPVKLATAIAKSVRDVLTFVK